MSQAATIPAGYVVCLASRPGQIKAHRKDSGCVICFGHSLASPAVVKKCLGKPLCEFSHRHDSTGEARSCPLVLSAASNSGCLVFRPGSPGIPVFALVPAEDTWRPAYVSADWVLVRSGKPVLLVDYKGSVAKSKRRDKAWARGRRILETELGVRCVEIENASDALAVVKAALSAKEAK